MPNALSPDFYLYCYSDSKGLIENAYFALNFTSLIPLFSILLGKVWKEREYKK